MTDSSTYGRKKLHKSIFSVEGKSAPVHPTECRYCSKPLRFKMGGGFWSSQSDDIVIGICFHCGWWWYHFGSIWESATDLTEATGRLKEFSVESGEVPNAELIRYINKNPDKLGSINPSKFEQVVADVYRDVLGCSIEYCSYARPDLGIDVVCLRTDTNQEFAIQAKRYKQPIKLALIHQFFGALFDNGFSEGYLVTSGRFQAGCYDTADRLREKSGVLINLVDGNRLLNFLNIIASGEQQEFRCPINGQGEPISINETSESFWFDHECY